MPIASLLRLVALSAIWGASFLFMRMAAPVLGPAWLIEARVGFAAVFLLVVGLIARRDVDLRAHWKHFVVLGLFNSALPFFLFACAARTLSASLLSILNATSPVWAAAIGAVWTRTPLTVRASFGLALGVAGVAILVGGTATFGAGGAAAIALGLGAACSYGIATNYAKRATPVSSFENAHGSMWAATLLLLPTVPFFPPAAMPDATVAAAVLALGVVCSGIAYLLYFRLIDDVGATAALTVTFLVPVFGVLWGHLVLGEPVGRGTLIGALAVLVGTALVTGSSPSSMRRRAAAPAE